MYTFNFFDRGRVILHLKLIQLNVTFIYVHRLKLGDLNIGTFRVASLYIITGLMVNT